MTDKPREWPNVAREARDRAAEEFVIIYRILQPIADEKRIFTQTEIQLRVQKAMCEALMGSRLLESVGAQTKP